MIEVKEVIISDLRTKGLGKDITDPVRTVLEIYTKEGVLLADKDSFGNYSAQQLIEFGQFCREHNKTDDIKEIFQSWAKI